MKLREPVSVTIAYLGDDGCGYTADGKHGIYGALPGETVTALPIARKRKKLYSRAVQVSHASADRVSPQCSVADVCGGCSLQHLHSARQLDLKTTSLKRHLGDTQPLDWLPPLQSRQYHYRSKARLSVRLVKKKGRVLVGFREKQKTYVTDTESCPILREPVDSLTGSLAVLIESLSEPESIPQIEVAMGDEVAALVIRHQCVLTASDELKLCHFAADHGIHLYLQPGSPESTHKLYPPDQNQLLTYELPEFGLTYRFRPHDFTQVNLAVNRLMVARAIELLACEQKDYAFDGFCGTGNFSLALARRVSRVLGVEQSLLSVERARQNAKDNGIDNVQFYAADLQGEALELPEFSSLNKALLDPPRSGAAGLVKLLASSNVERVVYISCNPETLARDVQQLAESGFEFKAAGIIDMFPHTTHIESIALLVR